MNALNSLNKEQYSAATAPFGHNLVIASAGTGKTSTIVARIAHLLNLGVKPDKILLLTFTNKAAREMLERLGRYFPKQITDKITAGTFHAVSYMLLKRLNKGVVLKQPAELKTLLKSLVERRQFYHISDIKSYGGAYLYDVYSLFQNSSEEDFIQWFSREHEQQSIYAEIYDDVLREFETEKAKFNYADFNDLLTKMRGELRKGAPILFDEILVDEYQDTNSLQGSLIDSFATKSLFCVGDFDQSIYAFNGANINIIGGFKDRYKNAQIYTLNVNYRSSSLILALANKVISNNPRLYPKELIVSRQGRFKSPSLMVFSEVYEQYGAIARMISNNANIKHDEVAIIFRNNSTADGMEVALREQGIKSKRKGGISFFESKEIKALIDLMAMLVNPRDIMAFIHLFQYAKGMGNAGSKEIFDALMSVGGMSLISGFLKPDGSVKVYEKKRKITQLGLFDEFEDMGEVSRFAKFGFCEDFYSHPVLKYPKLTGDGAVFLYEIYNFLRTVKNLTNPTNILKEAKNSKIYAIICDHIATKRATNRAGQLNLEQKNESLEKIAQKAGVLIQISQNYSDLERFYNFITIGANEMSEGEGVNLLSVHASKGLEFKQVFVIDLAQNRFPNLKLMGMGGSLEEERRLFYVAVTRAKDELYLSYAKFDKIKNVQYVPSQFLVEATLVSETK